MNTSTETNNKTDRPKKSFFKRNLAAIVLLILLMAAAAVFYFMLKINEKDFNNKQTLLIQQYESRIDSLKISNIKFAAKVFSWSVRSELIRNNNENLTQLITVFVQESGADLVQLIDPVNKVVMVSSDKKFEGTPYTGNLNMQTDHTLVLKEGGVTKVVIPVMGFNSMIGLLVIQLPAD